ncbi:MAG: L,D-transpeptidase family protein [Legionellales bacterium]|nr:L,D-transpeptidase family protein [Legionellales bacterium]
MLRYIVVVCSLLLGSQTALAYSTAQSSSSLIKSSNLSTRAVEGSQQTQLALLSPEQRQAKRLRRQEKRRLKAKQRELRRQEQKSLRVQNDNRHYQTRTTSNKKKKKVASKPKRAPFVNKFPQSRPATGSRVFVFDPSITQWGAYDAEGNLVKSGRASGGRAYCPDIKSACRTPAGQYSVYRRGSASCKSKKFPIGRGGAPMPYCTFFKGGYAIHGSYHVPDYNASHGCIRVEPHMAKWLSENFLYHGTSVVVKSYK